MSISTPILYSYWRSSCSWRVRLALNYKEIAYDIRPINIVKGHEQKSDEFRKINPMGKVPALVIDNHTLVESLAIMHYLEETRPSRPLLPKDFYERAKVRELCEIIASGIQPLQNVGLLEYIPGGDTKELEWAQLWITKGFQAVEKLLSMSAGKYSVGNEITMADLCLIPQIHNARKFKVDLTPYPIAVRIDNELKNHPAFIPAHPFRQPDCPPEFLQKY